MYTVLRLKHKNIFDTSRGVCKITDDNNYLTFLVDTEHKITASTYNRKSDGILYFACSPEKLESVSNIILTILFKDRSPVIYPFISRIMEDKKYLTVAVQDFSNEKKPIAEQEPILYNKKRAGIIGFTIKEEVQNGART